MAWRLGLYASEALIFRFGNRVLNRNDLVTLINRSVLGYQAVQKVHYIARGFVFNDAKHVVDVWNWSPIMYQRELVCVLP